MHRRRDNMAYGSVGLTFLELSEAHREKQVQDQEAIGGLLDDDLAEAFIWSVVADSLENTDLSEYYEGDIGLEDEQMLRVAQERIQAEAKERSSAFGEGRNEAMEILREQRRAN